MFVYIICLLNFHYSPSLSALVMALPLIHATPTPFPPPPYCTPPFFLFVAIPGIVPIEYFQRQTSNDINLLEQDVVEGESDEIFGVMTSDDCESNAYYLADMVNTLKATMDAYAEGGTNAGYNRAYRDLANVTQEYSNSNSILAINKLKNRYGNILAYDHSRVILPELPGELGSDYINANWVNGYKEVQAYIASQGPVPSSFISFWRMIWVYKVNVIVMVTHELEGGKIKCHRYWPGNLYVFG